MSVPPLEKKQKGAVTLGYWSIRGLAQPIRLLLKYTGTHFEDVVYTERVSEGDKVLLFLNVNITVGPTYSREEWTKVKYTLGLDFPNLPYLIDGEIKMTQSNAILAHLGRKNNMSGKTEAEMALVDTLANVAMDFRNGFVRLCYNREFESLKPKYLVDVKVKLEQYSNYLGDKPWFAGNEITYVDFLFYELFDQHREFEPKLFEGLDNLKAFMNRFEGLPAIKSYMASPEFIRRPINNPIAQWK